MDALVLWVFIATTTIIVGTLLDEWLRSSPHDDGNDTADALEALGRVVESVEESLGDVPEL